MLILYSDTWKTKVGEFRQNDCCYRSWFPGGDENGYRNTIELWVSPGLENKFCCYNEDDLVMCNYVFFDGSSYSTDNVIRIFGGDDALSEDFITWLQTYAVQIDS